MTLIPRITLPAVLTFLVASPALANVWVSSDFFFGGTSGSTLQEVVTSGSADDDDCLPGTQVTITAVIEDPSETIVSSNGASSHCSAAADTSHWLDVDSSPDGDWTFRATATNGYSNGCAYEETSLKKFRAVFQKHHFNSFIGKWVYQRNDAVCTGACQPYQWCSTSEYNWLYANGWKAATPAFSALSADSTLPDWFGEPTGVHAGFWNGNLGSERRMLVNSVGSARLSRVF